MSGFNGKLSRSSFTNAPVTDTAFSSVPGVKFVRPEAGSLGGAPLEEAKSWSKAKCGSNLATVVGDVTIIFPLIYAAALDKI